VLESVMNISNETMKKNNRYVDRTNEKKRFGTWEGDLRPEGVIWGDVNATNNIMIFLL